MYLATFKVYKKFKDPGSNRSLEICDRIFCWKEKWTNKGTDMHYVADSVTQNFKIISRVVSEKYLTEKSLHTDNTQTLLQIRQKLYTPYILRIPGVQLLQKHCI